jgi:hypothetical protein
MIDKQITCAALVLGLIFWPIATIAQDNSGTNPVNFTYDFRVYSELAQLPNDAGSSALTTAELRVPLGRDIAYLSDDPEESPFYDMGSRWQLRFRAKYKNLSLENPANLPFGASEVSGIGDFDARLLWIASASKKMVIAAGVEAFMDTASNDALGNGQTVLGPTAFAVFPGILGPGSLFAPGYQYVFDVGGGNGQSDISRSQLDLYFVWGLAGGRNWLIVDPQVIVDHEADNDVFATLEVEWGYMMVPESGISAYFRPGIGLGSDKLYDWNFEVGLKFVWR